MNFNKSNAFKSCVVIHLNQIKTDLNWVIDNLFTYSMIDAYEQ